MEKLTAKIVRQNDGSYRFMLPKVVRQWLGNPDAITFVISPTGVELRAVEKEVEKQGEKHE